MPPPSDIVKVAIEWPGANAQLLEIDQVCSCCESQGCQGMCLGLEAPGIVSKGSPSSEAHSEVSPSLSFRNGPWHLSSRKCVMGRLK